MEYLIIAINSLLLFILSNVFVLNKGYNLNIPVIISVLFIVFINIFPAILNKKLLCKNLARIRNGYSLLLMFLVNLVLDVVLYLVSYFKFDIDIHILLENFISLFIILSVVFWNGIIRVYLFSKQLGIRYRFWGIVFGLIPIAHIIMLIKIIKVCKKEVYFENSKIQLNIDRKEEQVCNTKYPLLLVHGIFFRDYEKINYWGRIPDELVKNGATIYYGNHSSSLSVKDSAEELANRIKEIIKETNCEKVNVIAHSKGGLDTRYAISNLGMDKYIASLSMINTPNHGCEFADYLLTKAPKGLTEKVAQGYNFTLKKLGDVSPDFIAGVTDLTSKEVSKLNEMMPNSDQVYYKAYGSVLKKATGGRFPLNLTNRFVKLFDGKNDGLVGIKSFPLDDNDNYSLIETPYERGISHGDVIDLNHENIDGYDVREFYVKLVSDLKQRGL